MVCLNFFLKTNTTNAITIITYNVIEEAKTDDNFELTCGLRVIKSDKTSNCVTIVRKFFLHVSADEQKKRFLERIDNPEKNWKFSSADAKERGHWDEYMKAYEEMIRNTATKDSPWYVIPADNKWFTRLVVAAAVIDTLASLDLKYPDVGEDKLKELAEAKSLLK